MLQLAIVIGASVLLYAALTWIFRLPPLIGRSRLTIGTLTNRSATGAITIGLAGSTLYALYIAGALALWQQRVTRGMQQWVWGGAIVASLVLLWAYPATSTDIFDYIFRSRMAVVYDANPYLALPNAFKSDPFFRYVGWPNAPSAYGPLWEHLSVVLAWLGGDSLFRNVLLYKSVAILAFLLCGALIHATVHDPRYRLLGVYLWLWSPLALWEFAGVGHNDSLMVLSLLLALFFVQRDRYALALLALVGGALFKFLPAIFAPLVVLAWMRQEATWSRRIGVALLALVLAAAPTIMLYAPYWDLPSNFVQLALDDQFRAIWQGRTTTLRNVTVREGFLNASPLAVISYVLQQPRNVEQINKLLAILGFASVDKTGVRAAVSSLGTGILAVGLIWQCRQVWFRSRSLQQAFWGLMLWYVLVSSQWFQPWYVLWLLAIFALRAQPVAFGWITAWALMAQASYLLQYTVLPNMKLSGQTLQAQVYYLLLIYLLPLVVWLVAEAQRQHNRRSHRTLAPEH